MKKEVLKNLADIVVFTIVLASVMRLLYQIAMPDDFFMGLVCAAGTWIVGLSISYWSTKHFMRFITSMIHISKGE